MIRRSQKTLARAGTVGVVVGGLCLTAGLGGSPAHAAEAPVGLGTAAPFAVLAGQSVSNTGPSKVTGGIGVTPGTAVTGIPPLVQTGGALHVADAVALQAQKDLTTAYDSAAGRPTVTDVTGQDLGNRTFTSGVVSHTSGMQLTGTVTLDAEGDPSAVFIFKAGSTLVTAPNSTVSLVNGASPCNVYWQVGSSTTLDTRTTFVGTVMSLTSATLATGASVQGRVLARNGSVTLDTNVITRPACATDVTSSPTASPSTTSASTPTATPTSTPTSAVSPSSSTPPSSGASTGSGTGGGNGSGGNGNNGSDDETGGSGDGSGGDDGGNGGGPGSDGSSSSRAPVVPAGHPETGLGGSAAPAGPGLLAWWLLAGSAAAAAVVRLRRLRAVRPG